jgi:hypothetical protein
MELETDAELRLWLAPDWTRPEDWLGALSTYLRAAHPRGSTCLCLATGATDPDLVAMLVTTACERLAGELPFADVLIVPPDAPPDGVTPVASAGDVLAALAAPPPATAQSGEDAALAAALATGLRAMASGDPARGDDGALADVRRLSAYV